MKENGVSQGGQKSDKDGYEPLSMLDRSRGLFYMPGRNKIYNRATADLPWQIRWLTSDDCKIKNGCQLELDERVIGVFLRYKWSQLNPSEGQYHFRNVGKILDIIHDAGKVASIVVMGGKYTPEWVIDNGAKTFPIPVHVYKAGAIENTAQPYIPLPWNDVYINAYGRMIQALSEYLKEKPSRYNTIVLMKLGGLVVHSAENRMLPLNAFFTEKEKRKIGKEKLRTKLGKAWAKVDYTEEKVLRANRQFAQQIAKAFPDQLIGMSNVPGTNNRFPTVINGTYMPNKQNRTNRKLATQLADMFGDRAIVNSTVLHDINSAHRPYLEKVQNHGGNIAFQLQVARKIGCGNLGSSCNRGQLVKAMNAAINAGTVFIEVHAGQYGHFHDLWVKFNKKLKNQ